MATPVMSRVGSMARADGFSIIELLVVLTIIGFAGMATATLLGTALPRFSLDAGAERLAKDLRLARAQAMAQGVTVVFPEVDADGRPILEPATQRAIAGLELEIVMPVRYTPDGWSAGGVLRLTRGGEVRQLIVTQPLGSLRVEAEP